MRFLDYNGTGGLDAQDLATSVIVEEAAREEEPTGKPTAQPLSGNAGCATMISGAVVIALIILLAL